jgi:O-antigen ligase
MRLLRRRWWAAALALVLGIAGLGPTLVIAPVTFKTTSTFALLKAEPPTPSPVPLPYDPKSENPYIRLNDLAIVVNVLRTVMVSAPVRQILREQGVAGVYSVGANYDNEHGPLVDVAAVAPSYDSAVASAKLVLAETMHQLAILQTAQGTDPAHFIPTQVVMAPESARPQVPAKTRRLVAIGALLAEIVIAAALIADAVARRRRPVPAPDRFEPMPAASATRKFDTIFLLQIYIWLLFIIPSGLRIGPLGAVGSPATLFAIGLFLIWVMSVLAPSITIPGKCSPIRLVLAIFWASVLVSYAVMNKYSAASDELNSADAFLLTLLGYTGVALVTAESIRNKHEMMRLIRTVVAAIAAVSVIGLLQSRAHFDVTKYIAKIPVLTTYRSIDAIQDRSGLVRAAGTADHPIEFGVLLGIGLALALQVGLFDRGAKRWKRYTWLGVIALGIPIAVSRSAILAGVVVMIAFFAGTTKKTRLRLLPVLGAFLAVVFVAVPGLLGTLVSVFAAGESDTSVSTRTDDYAAVSPYLRRSPWVGRGPASFVKRLRLLDNQYLKTLIETGLVGFAALLMLFGLIVWLGRSGRRRATTESDRNLGQMFAGAGMGIIVSAAAFDYLSFPMVTAGTALTTGLAGAYWRFSKHAVPAPVVAEETREPLPASVTS